MLRRPATVITLTPEDVLRYDESVQERSSYPQIDRHQEQGHNRPVAPKDMPSGEPMRTEDDR